MSLNFQLLKNEKPVPLDEIDDEIREFLGYRKNPDEFLFGWVDLVGLEIAWSGNWASSYQKYEDDPELINIVRFLEKNFTIKNWAN